MNTANAAPPPGAAASDPPPDPGHPHGWTAEAWDALTRSDAARSAVWVCELAEELRDAAAEHAARHPEVDVDVLRAAGVTIPEAAARHADYYLGNCRRHIEGLAYVTGEVAQALGEIVPEPPATPPAEPRDATGEPFRSGPLTDAGWEDWLDQKVIGGGGTRRESCARESPAQVAGHRARLGRLYALRASPLPAELAAVAAEAEDLRDRLRSVVRRYAPLEGARAISAAGLWAPPNSDHGDSWVGDHFAEAHDACRRAAKALGKLLPALYEATRQMLPADRPADERRVAA